MFRINSDAPLPDREGHGVAGAHVRITGRFREGLRQRPTWGYTAVHVATRGSSASRGGMPTRYEGERIHFCARWLENSSHPPEHRPQAGVLLEPVVFRWVMEDVVDSARSEWARLGLGLQLGEHI